MAKELPKELDWLLTAHLALRQAKTVQEFKAVYDQASAALAALKLHASPLPPLVSAAKTRNFAAELKAIAARRIGEEIAKLGLTSTRRRKRPLGRNDPKKTATTVRHRCQRLLTFRRAPVAIRFGALGSTRVRWLFSLSGTRPCGVRT